MTKGPITPLPGLKLKGPKNSELQLKVMLGSGSFGVVFEAHDTKSKKKYAVKFPQISEIGDEAETIAFRNELLAAGKVSHPNIVQILHVDSNPSDVPPYLVMELIKSGTLKDTLQAARKSREQLPIGLIRNWMESLASAVQEINKYFLHRDLKPDNILRNEDTLKISDFGLAKIINAATRSRTFKGGQHVLYMAPEGWKGETNGIQLDMYSLGLVFYEMACLKFPYEIPPGWDIEAIKEMHLFQSVPPLISNRSDIGQGFSDFILRLLAKKPSDRFQTWEECREKLKGSWDPVKGGSPLSPATARLQLAFSQAYQEKMKLGSVR